MRCAQVRHGLDAEQLRRGRKRKSESGLRDWTEAEDVQLLKVAYGRVREARTDALRHARLQRAGSGCNSPASMSTHNGEWAVVRD